MDHLVAESKEGNTFDKSATTAPARADQSMDARAEQLLRQRLSTADERTNRMFAKLLLGQWLFGIGCAWFVSPRTWIGETSEPHVHLLAAVVLGGLFTLFPVALIKINPAAHRNRYAIAIGQMLISSLLIHLTGGRIETHFHIFGSLAFLAFYRDIRVLAVATGIVCVDHFVRGVWFPQSVFGVFSPEHFRWIEHGLWVVFEDVILVRGCILGMREQREFAREHVEATMLHERLEVEKREVDRARDAAEKNARSEGERLRLSSQIAEVAAAIEQLAAESSSVEESVKGALETANVGGAQAAEGRRLVSETTAMVEGLDTVLQDAAAALSTFSSELHEIQDMTSQIHAIGEETNMLALNASIEAARAGSHGRGFAVVASEVKDLANKVGEASMRVGEIVAGITRGSSELVGALELGRQRIAEGQQYTLAANAALEAISAESESLISIVDGVARSCTESVREAESLAERVRHVA